MAAARIPSLTFVAGGPAISFRPPTKLPDAIRAVVWNKHIGAKVGSGMCFCCGLAEISRDNFECGHIISRAAGGTDEINNLVPVCGKCNKSVGKKNMLEFIRHYKIDSSPLLKMMVETAPRVQSEENPSRKDQPR